MDLKSCQSRALECARRAVYSHDPKVRKAYTEAAAWWAKRAQEIMSQQPRGRSQLSEA
jgi:hypothetical protein